VPFFIDLCIIGLSFDDDVATGNEPSKASEDSKSDVIDDALAIDDVEELADPLRCLCFFSSPSCICVDFLKSSTSAVDGIYVEGKSTLYS